jgi:AcrR family transcriptional regulator
MPERARRRAELVPLVVEAALAIAAEAGWEQVRLHAIAARTGRSLPEIGRHFRDVDAIANAWFAQARQALLAVTAEELAGLPADERLALAFGRWLDHLAAHRAVARQILRYKLHPPHLHHWVPLVFDLSRLVHDLLDAARVAGAGRLRQAQEVGLTLIVLASVRDWLRDGSPGQERSKRRLARRLACAGRLAGRMNREGQARPDGGSADQNSTVQPSGPTSPLA